MTERQSNKSTMRNNFTKSLWKRPLLASLYNGSAIYAVKPDKNIEVQTKQCVWHQIANISVGT